MGGLRQRRQSNQTRSCTGDKRRHLSGHLPAANRVQIHGSGEEAKIIGAIESYLGKGGITF